MPVIIATTEVVLRERLKALTLSHPSFLWIFLSSKALANIPEPVIPFPQIGVSQDIIAATVNQTSGITFALSNKELTDWRSPAEPGIGRYKFAGPIRFLTLVLNSLKAALRGGGNELCSTLFANPDGI